MYIQTRAALALGAVFFFWMLYVQSGDSRQAFKIEDTVDSPAKDQCEAMKAKAVEAGFQAWCYGDVI